MDAWGAHRPAAGLPESLVRDASRNNSPRARHPRRLLALAALNASRRCSASPERRRTEAPCRVDSPEECARIIHLKLRKALVKNHRWPGTR
ncbi:unnamed protein product [Urochloa humidicola]